MLKLVMSFRLLIRAKKCVLKSSSKVKVVTTGVAKSQGRYRDGVIGDLFNTQYWFGESFDTLCPMVVLPFHFWGGLCAQN